MLTLACDTSGKSLSVALCRDGRLLGETSLRLGYNHAVTYMPQTMALLTSCDCQLGDVDLFACAAGPGSYTGIRIGVSTVKTMAYAAGRPAIGVSTLAALALPYSGLPGLVVCPLLDARNGRVYAAAYVQEQLLLPQANWLASDFLAALASAASTSPLTAGSRSNSPLPTICLLGDGADAALAAWQSPADLYIYRAPASCDIPRASFIAQLAEKKLATGQSGDPQQLSADYFSPAAAERQRKHHD